MTLILPSHADVMAAAHAATVEPVAFARRLLDGEQLPPIKSTDFVEADVAVQRAALLVGGLAWVLEDPRRAERAVMVEASHDVAADPIWRGYGTRRVSHEEMQRRRAGLGLARPA